MPAVTNHTINLLLRGTTINEQAQTPCVDESSFGRVDEKTAAEQRPTRHASTRYYPTQIEGMQIPCNSQYNRTVGLEATTNRTNRSDKKSNFDEKQVKTEK